MKNNGKIIFLIILLSIIVFSLTMFLVHTINHGLNLNGIFSKITIGEAKVIYEKSYNIDEFTDININEEYGNIIFKENSNNSVDVEIYGDEETDVEVNIKNNALNIVHKKKNKLTFLNLKNLKHEIIISLPKAYLNNINIKNNFGDCEICDLENSNINIDIDCGDVELGKVKNVNVKSDYGDIKIKEILNKCKIASDCGDIKIDKMFIKENSEIESDYGDIKIGETSDINIDANIDLGDKKINNNNISSDITLKIKSDCGDIKIN